MIWGNLITENVLRIDRHHGNTLLLQGSAFDTVQYFLKNTYLKYFISCNTVIDHLPLSLNRWLILFKIPPSCPFWLINLLYFFHFRICIFYLTLISLYCCVPFLVLTLERPETYTLGHLLLVWLFQLIPPGATAEELGLDYYSIDQTEIETFIIDYLTNLTIVNRAPKGCPYMLPLR